MALAHRVVGPHGDRLWVAAVGHLLERDVFRDIHDDGAGPAAAGDVEGFFQGQGHIAGVFDQEIVFHDGAGDTDRIALLERIEADGVCRHLPGDDHHGNAVHVGRGDAGDRVGDARAGRHERNAHITGGAGIAIRRMNGRLLMAHQNVLNRLLLEKSVVDVQHGTAGIAPDIFDVFGLKRLDENFSAAQLVGSRVLRCARRGGYFFLRYFHDEPLRISLTKNLGCFFPPPCGPGLKLKVKAISARNNAPNQNPFALLSAAKDYGIFQLAPNRKQRA